MRILIYGMNFAPEVTGAGKFSGEMAAWFTNHGHEVRVVTAPPYYPEWRLREGYSAWRYSREGDGPVRVLRCPLWVPSEQTGGRRVVHLASFALSSLPVVLYQGLVWRPDVVGVVVPTLLSAPAAWLAARLGGAHAWLHVHDFEIDAAFELKLLRGRGVRRLAAGLERWLMGRFDLVSTISPPMRERLEGKGVKAERTVLFPNWVDANAIRPLGGVSPLRDELGIGTDEVVALYAGNMGEKQGLQTLIEMARRIQDHREIVVVLSGEGAARARLADSARGLANVRFLGLYPVERLNDLLNMADIHLLPQRPEAADLLMPSKLGGMLASGRPVIAGAREGTQIAEMVRDCGVVVPPDDADAVAEAVLRLAGDGDIRRALGRKGRARALAEWDGESILERFEAELAARVSRKRGSKYDRGRPAG